MASRIKILLCCLSIAGFLLCCRAYSARHDGYIVGCANNTAGMLVNYAISRSGSQGLRAQDMGGLSSYMMADCCSSASAWTLYRGDFAAAVLCPDAAESFLAESKGYLLAGPLTYRTEVVASKGARQVLRVGYMNGQERQRDALRKKYGADVKCLPIMASSLPYALHIGEIDAAVLDLATAVTLDYQYASLEDEMPTAVLVVSEEFYNAPEYLALLSAFENNMKTIEEYEPFVEAMRFLFSEELGRKEYEKWRASEKKYPVPGQIARPAQQVASGSASIDYTP